MRSDEPKPDHARSEPDGASSNVVPLEETPWAALQGSVLVVEDNAANRMVIGAFLEDLGLDHGIAEGGRQALALLGEREYDLVLMDIMMPELDGMETTRRIRALPGRAASIPVVALTANAMKGDREKYLAAGMDAYVSKPIRGHELYGEIARFLAAPERRAAS